MEAELGHFALCLACGVAVLQAILPFVGWRTARPRWMAIGASAAQSQFLLVAFAYVMLTLCFVHNDFSVTYVAENSHSQLPLIYRICAVWGAHEGSLLLWLLMLSGWGAAVSIFNRRLPLDISALVMATLGLVSLGLMLFTLLTSNPFLREFPVPTEGRDLNPLLQDPGLIIHPPMLYMGYVGTSVAFAFAIAALATGRLDAAWARWSRPWTTVAWAFLTVGITLGSWWAYNELGWGGWWFWDPVENASFMPWLVSTALIHSLAVTEKRGLLKSWTVLLAIIAFGLSLLGTFLVRSGIVVSVHAFASDPARGVFILALLGALIGSALVLYAFRAGALASEGEVALFSREGFLLLNNVFLVAAAAAVLIGTLQPMVNDALGLAKISVGPPYFNALFLPLMFPLGILVGLSAAVSWKRGKLGESLRRLRWALLAAAISAALLPFVIGGHTSVLAMVGGAVGAWIICGACYELVHRIRARKDRLQGLRGISRGVWGMTLAHVGLGVWALGISFVSLYSAEKDVRLSPGQSAEIGSWQFLFKGTQHAVGPNYEADEGTVVISRNGSEVVTLHPEKRWYPSQQNMMTEAAVSHRPWRDLYVALGEPIDNGDWALRLYVKPMMGMVWYGGFLMALGGLIAVSDRRYRSERAAQAGVDTAAVGA